MTLGYQDNYHKPQYKITDKTLEQHLYVVGKSGTGKTTLLLNMIVQDATAGLGMLVVDPHGDLAEDVLHHIPPERIDDVIFVDPTSDHCPIINIFQTDKSVTRDISAADDLFKSVWPEAWLARSTWFFKKCARCLAQGEKEGLFTIAHLIKLIQSRAYRDEIYPYIRSTRLKGFLNRFDGWSKQFQEQVITPVLNKSEEWIDNEYLAAIVGRTRSKFTMREAMDSGKIIICKFPRGLMGKEASMLACSLMLSKVNNAGLARADTNVRRDFRVYVDEAASALKGVDVESFMTESRKFKVQLVFATQMLKATDKASEEALCAILGNSGTLVLFRLSAKDAVYLDEEFYGHFPPSKYVGLEMGHMIVRTLIKGTPTSLAELVGNPRPDNPRPQRHRRRWIRKVKDTSKRRFAVSKNRTVENIDKFFEEKDPGHDPVYNPGHRGQGKSLRKRSFSR
jgi:energy-coupling factor transporter ATP-binding protein EcfA2